MSRNFSDSQRETIWNNYFGSGVESGKDAFDRTVSHSNFETDHIYPFDNGGKTVIENGMPLHPKSNEEKSNDMSGTVNGKSFHVQGKKDAGVVNVDGVAFNYKGRK